jgi:MFS family permease
VVTGSLALVGVGLAQKLPTPQGFWLAIGLMTILALMDALAGPLQQAYMNDSIPSEQRATVLSFVSLMGSAGGVVSQPALGRVADAYSLGTGYVVAGVVYAVRLPFMFGVRKLDLPADTVIGHATPEVS